MYLIQYLSVFLFSFLFLTRWIRQFVEKLRKHIFRVSQFNVRNAVTKDVFNAGKILVTTVERVNVKTLFTAFCYNPHQLRILRRKEIFSG
jgi:IS5 family transposase